MPRSIKAWGYFLAASTVVAYTQHAAIIRHEQGESLGFVLSVVTVLGLMLARRSASADGEGK